MCCSCRLYDRLCLTICQQRTADYQIYLLKNCIANLSEKNVYGKGFIIAGEKMLSLFWHTPRRWSLFSGVTFEWSWGFCNFVSIHHKYLVCWFLCIFYAFLYQKEMWFPQERCSDREIPRYFNIPEMETRRFCFLAVFVFSEISR